MKLVRRAARTSSSPGNAKPNAVATLLSNRSSIAAIRIGAKVKRRQLYNALNYINFNDTWNTIDSPDYTSEMMWDDTLR